MYKESKYAFGFDIGTGSIGWAVVDFDGEKIMNLGVRKFELPVLPKNGASLAMPRKEARSQRRLIRRKRMRRVMMLRHLRSSGLLTQKQYEASRSNEASPENIFYSPVSDGRDAATISVWQLRAEGLSRRLNNLEWARVIFHLTKHRGYQSNAVERKQADEKGSATEEEKETRKVLGSIASLRKKLVEFSADGEDHSFGEMMYKKGMQKRNSEGEYSSTPGREEILNELEILFRKQRSFGNPHTSEDFEERCREILNARRSYADGPESGPYKVDFQNLVGKCTFEVEEDRSPRESLSAVKFKLYTRLVHLRIRSEGRLRELSREEVEAAYVQIRKRPKVTYKQLRKIIGLEEHEKFKGRLYTRTYSQIRAIIYKNDEPKKEFYRSYVKNNETLIPSIATILNSDAASIDEVKNVVVDNNSDVKLPEKIANALVVSVQPEEEIFFVQENLYALEKKLSAANYLCSDRDINKIIEVLALHRGNEVCSKLRKLGLPDDIALELAGINFSGFMHLSVKAMDRIIPHLLDEASYDKACLAAGYQHAGQSSSIQKDVKNPTVLRAFVQTQKVMRALVREYGLPEQVCLEVARDLGRSHKEKMALQRKMRENESYRRTSREHFRESFGRLPWGREEEVWRLYKEQGGKCLYCGNPFDIDSMFSTKGKPAAKIEHTLPFSRSHDNRQCNKTLSCTKCNREKGEQTPFEFFGRSGGSSSWHEFSERCRSQVKDAVKLELLLTTEWDEEVHGERYLNDTRYITRIMQNWLETEYSLVATAKKGEKRSIITIKWEATSVLRKIWQLERYKYNDDRVRESQNNHALDAAVIAVTGHSYFQQISKSKRRHELYEKGSGDGRVVSKIKQTLQPPWEGYIEELQAFFSDDPNTAIKYCSGHEKYSGQNLSPIFVSWMPHRSIRGEVNGPNPYKLIPEQRGEDGNVQQQEKYIKRIALNKLTDKLLEKMHGRYDQSGKETPLYTALCKRLELYANNAEKAFQEPFYKPSKHNAPQVKKISIVYEAPSGLGPRLLGGITDNGKMIRVDVFRRQTKKGDAYFFVPIYAHHRSMATLPMKGINQGKHEDDWEEMKAEEFYCSFYSYDYVVVNFNDGTVKEGYYISTHRSGGYIAVRPHDKTGTENNIDISVKTRVSSFQKFQVDVLGRRFPVSLPEKRQELLRPMKRG